MKRRWALQVLALLTLLALTPPSRASDRVPIGALRAQPSGDLLELYEERGSCVAGAGRAVYVIGPGSPVPSARGRRIAGCWLFARGQIFALFDDGDRMMIPLELFEWATGKKPGMPVQGLC